MLLMSTGTIVNYVTKQKIMIKIHVSEIITILLYQKQNNIPYFTFLFNVICGEVNIKIKYKFLSQLEEAAT